MNFMQIKYFIEVAKIGSFSRAAIALGISQPMLSRHIRSLEVSLRYTLFHRNGRGVELTPAGTILLDKGMELLGSVKNIEMALEEIRGAPEGRVTIGLPTRISQAVTTHLVKDFQKHFPRATISIAEGSSNLLHEWLLVGKVEIALLFDPPYSSDLELEPIMSEELYLVGSKKAGIKQAKRVSFSELNKFPIIMPRIPNATRTVIMAAAAKAGVSLNISIEVDTIHNILELIGSSMGFGIVPLSATLKEHKNTPYIFSKIHSPAVKSHLYLATSRHHKHTVLASQMRRMLSSINLNKLVWGQKSIC